jgi:hypothetical protein
MSMRPIGDRPAPRPISGAVRMSAVRIRRALVVAGCGVLSVGLSACESTEQESARIGRENRVGAQTAHGPLTHSHAGARSREHRDGLAHGASGKGLVSR